MIEVGNTYTSAGGFKVTVDAVCGDEVYYSDSYGCHYHRSARIFAFQYIGTKEYYILKGEPEKAEMLLG